MREMLNQGKLGIHPPGALGVGFYIHANAEYFIGCSNDGITMPLRNKGMLHLEENGRERLVPLKDRVAANFLEADALDILPELIQVCCNPVQLKQVTGELVCFLESLTKRGRLNSFDDIRSHVPILLIMPNGIVMEKTIEDYSDQLHESVLLNRLPGVTQEMIALLIERVVRGISLQAGGRRGWGSDTVYIIEKKGALLFAGGGEFERTRIEEIFNSHDYPYTHEHDASGTRIEFDKAMISIVLNVGGLIHTVKQSGEVIDLRMGDLCTDESKTEFITSITKATFDVGRIIGAYSNNDSYEEIWEHHRNTILKFAGHVTSSLKTFYDVLPTGLNKINLFSNEEWILKPLIRYATKAGLKEAEDLFNQLVVQVQESLARAINFRDQNSAASSKGIRSMTLAAQRNISIELYEDGPENIVVLGTMLDNEHLIKLEITINLPDEQITDSNLNMIRIPFPVCKEVTMIADRLIGLRVERGVLSEVGRRVGGQAGCLHIKELAMSIVNFAGAYLVQRRAGIDPKSQEYVQAPAEERFRITKDVLKGSCIAYCQATAQGLDKNIGIRKLGEMHANSIPLGECEPSLGVILKDRAGRWADKTYIRHRDGDSVSTISWKSFAETAFNISRNLIKLGVRPGDRVCVISENSADMFMTEMGIMSIGAVSVPVFAGYHEPQIAYVLNHARPKFLIVSGHLQLHKINPDRHEYIDAYYSINYTKECEKWGAIDFKSLTNDDGVSQNELEERINAVTPNSICMVMYTSGTTGPPKGVRLTHKNLISQQKAISLLWDINENDAFMNILPWHHSFGGLFERFMSFYNGAELCLDDSRGKDIDRIIENWKHYNPTIFFCVPRVHDMLISQCRDHQSISNIVFNERLRLVFTAGAPCPAQIELAYRDHNIPVLEGWGLTETSPCVTVTDSQGDWQSGYVGFPIPGVSIRIASDGEILVHGPNVMQGYLHDDEATAHVIDEDGWLHTGDLGEFTRDGLRILNRKDGAFKLATGEKVHPQRIEVTIADESPLISTAVVVGSGKDFVGALIYPNRSRLRAWAVENDIQAELLHESPEVRSLYAAELERINDNIDIKYQRIARAILADEDPLLERGELTPSGKIVRTKVSESYRHQIEMMYDDEPPVTVIKVISSHLQGVK